MSQYQVGDTVNNRMSIRDGLGNPTNADFLPTALLYIDNVATATVVTVTNTGVGFYNFDYVVPAGVAYADLQLEVTGDIGGVGFTKYFEDQIDHVELTAQDVRDSLELTSGVNLGVSAQLTNIQNCCDANQVDLTTIISTGGAGPWTTGAGGPGATIDCDAFMSDIGCAFGNIADGSLFGALIDGFYARDCTDVLRTTWATQNADIILRRDGCEAEQSDCGDCNKGKSLLGVVSLTTTEYCPKPANDNCVYVPIKDMCNGTTLSFFRICDKITPLTEKCCKEPVINPVPATLPPNCGC